jgi:hypothetical protein
MLVYSGFILEIIWDNQFLSDVTGCRQTNWGMHLAIALLKKGASFRQMEFTLGKTAIHIGVQLALETGKS